MDNLSPLSAFLIMAAIGVVIGLILIGIAMVRKGLSAKGGGCYTRDGYYQDF